MSDRYCGFTVSLTRDIGEIEAQRIADSIRLMRGVHEVEPVVATPEMQIAEERARAKLETLILATLKPGPFSGVFRV